MHQSGTGSRHSSPYKPTLLHPREAHFHQSSLSGIANAASAEQSDAVSLNWSYNTWAALPRLPQSHAISSLSCNTIELFCSLVVSQLSCLHWIKSPPSLYLKLGIPIGFELAKWPLFETSKVWCDPVWCDPFPAPHSFHQCHPSPGFCTDYQKMPFHIFKWNTSSKLSESLLFGKAFQNTMPKFFPSLNFLHIISLFPPYHLPLCLHPWGLNLMKAGLKGKL